MRECQGHVDNQVETNRGRIPRLVTPAAATAATAVAAAASAAATTATIAASAAATALFARASFVHGQAATINLFEVEGLNGCLSLAIVVDFDEAKSFAAAGVTVLDDSRVLDLAKLRKELFQTLARNAVSQIPNIQSHAHYTIP
jgi:hypothetical protein